MTIIEAIKSGKPFKRAGWDNCPSEFPSSWMHYDEELNQIGDTGGMGISFGAKNILATDWEVLVCEKHEHVSSAEILIFDPCPKCPGKEIPWENYDEEETSEYRLGACHTHKKESDPRAYVKTPDGGLLNYPPKPSEYCPGCGCVEGTLHRKVCPVLAQKIAATTHTCSGCKNPGNCKCGDKKVDILDVKKKPEYQEMIYEVAKDLSIKCECGADKIKSGGHSPWCPKWKK